MPLPESGSPEHAGQGHSFGDRAGDSWEREGEGVFWQGLAPLPPPAMRISDASQSCQGTVSPGSLDPRPQRASGIALHSDTRIMGAESRPGEIANTSGYPQAAASMPAEAGPALAASRSHQSRTAGVLGVTWTGRLP